MKTLMLTVGTGRNRKDIAKAILFCIENHKPDKVIFLCSSKTFQETMPEIRMELNGTIETQEYQCSDENDVQKLFLEYLEYARQAKEQSDEFIVDFTSGTKAMTAAVFASAMAVEANIASYVVGDRDEGGRVIASTEVKSLNPNMIIGHAELMKAKKLFNEMDYSAASKIAGKLLDCFQNQSRLNSFAHSIYYLGKAYMSWESFDWKKAGDLLKTGLNCQANIEICVDGKKIKDQIEMTEKLRDDLKKNRYRYERLIDLYANAKRRYNQGRYDDSLTRLYRAFEYMLQIRLMEQFDIDTSDVSITTLKKNKISGFTIKKLQRKKTGDDKIKLGLRDDIELLAELKDDLGNKFAKWYFDENWKPVQDSIGKAPCGRLQTCLNERNGSYLAHGTKTINKKVPDKMLKMFEEALKFLIGENEFDEQLKTAQFVKIK